jgi:hypothetical protein
MTVANPPRSIPEPQRFMLAAKLRSYLGEHDAAIDVLTEGLQRHPTSPHLLRHRGEFLLTVMRLEEALEDFAAAEEVLGSMDDEIDFYRPQLVPEMERLILGRKAELLVTPTPVDETTLQHWRHAYKGSLKSSVAYHDALASYLLGDMARAAERFRATLAIAVCDDTRSAATHWLYLSLRRAGDDAAAAALLDGTPADLAVNERSYADLLDLYRGRVSAQELQERIAVLPPRASVTRAYGLGAWLVLEGHLARGVEVLRRLVTVGDRTAFGHLAATVDLAQSDEPAR